jgi:hypothetical protein
MVQMTLTESIVIALLLASTLMHPTALPGRVLE